MAHAPENTLAAFRTAKALGATGFETDAWVTRDGIVVLHHDEHVIIDGVPRQLADLDRAELPPHIPALAELYAECGTGIQICIDVKDGKGAAAIVDVARAAGPEALANLWLVGHFHRAQTWRALDPTIHIVASWNPRDRDPRPLLRAVKRAGLDAINMRAGPANPLIALACHSEGVPFMVWDVHTERVARRTARLRPIGMHGNSVPILLNAIAGPTRGVA